MNKNFLSYLLFLAAVVCIIVAGLSIFTTFREAASAEAVRYPLGRLFLLAVLAGMLYSAGQYVRKS